MSTTAPRLFWVDNLRTAMILLVVNMHACVTVSHVGDWYYMLEKEPTGVVKLLFLLWQGHLQAFFMGLLFFIAGYFAERSLSRRGVKSFLSERLWRLGVPTLFYMLVIHPFILLGLNPWHNDYPSRLDSYLNYLRTGKFIGSNGPLWFAFALLLFCLVFAGIRVLTGRGGTISGEKRTVDLSHLSSLSIVALGAGLGILSFLVRLVQPIGTSISNFQLCFFSQYIVFFLLGIFISKYSSLATLASVPALRRVGLCAVLCGPILLSVIGLSSGVTGVKAIGGGWNGLAFSYAMWEQIIGTGLAAGAIALFARYVNNETPLSRWLSDRAFGVYVFHSPILVAVTMLMEHLPLPALLMALLLTVATLICSFLFTDLIRRIPGVNNII